MKLKVGIVGLPNVGKSTLFNALLKKQVADVAAYPFCTIEPNVGVVAVPDERLNCLAHLVGAAKITPAVVEFVDIAGLVRGAAQGEGLGNKFLAHIREASLIVEVVRFFEDKNVARVGENARGDVATIENELLLADLQTLAKQKMPRGDAPKEAKILWAAVEKLRRELDRGKPARAVDLSPEERLASQQLFLLTAKPIIYLANLSEEQLRQPEKVLAGFPYQPLLPLSAKLEAELASFSPEEQKAYLQEFGLENSGLDRLIRQAYLRLGLISFLTAGPKEARAWTIKKGTSAQEAAGVIHSDFARKFIKAEVVDYQTFCRQGGWENCRAAGKVRHEGRDYLIKDGEVIEFKVGG